jgi:hypothetical protein
VKPALLVLVLLVPADFGKGCPVFERDDKILKYWKVVRFSDTVALI